MSDPSVIDPLDDLRAARTSEGAPSARNLIVTVFGDALAPHGHDVEISVAALARLLDGFGVSERLVRTSLTRLVNDDLLTSRSAGRRSYYRLAPSASDLFRNADDRIYRGTVPDWDGRWTLVVIDGGDATADRRAQLRHELSWLGLGAVTPNVMGSPVVAADAVTETIDRIGGFSRVLVSRSELVESEATIAVTELARRCLEIDELGARYAEFVARFDRYRTVDADQLSPGDAFKLRILLVASFRRIALSEPLIPLALRPDAWIGDSAREVFDELYRKVAAGGECFLADVAEPRSLDPEAVDLFRRFGPDR